MRVKIEIPVLLTSGLTVLVGLYADVDAKLSPSHIVSIGNPTITPVETEGITDGNN